MTLAKTSKGSKPPAKDTKRSRSASSHSSRSSRSRSRSSSHSSRSSSSSSKSSSSASRSRSSRSSSSSSRSSNYKRKFRSESNKRSQKRSKSPSHPTRLYIGRLTRNVNKDHVYEIFSAYGKIINVDMPMDRVHQHLNRGFAYVEYESHEDAEKAVKYMDGGQVDGQVISASKVDLQRARGPTAPPPPPPARRPSGGQGWRPHGGSPIRRRRFGSPARRSPPRRRISRSPRSRTPIRDRRRRDSRSSSSTSSR